MADYQYASDKGVPSYNAIIAFQHTSGVPFNVTATTNGNHVSGSWHYSGNAVDSSSTAQNMVNLAKWWMQYAPYMAELIHSGGSGFFVKNGKIVAASFYAAVVGGHYNHVHAAITLSGLAAAQRGGATGPPTGGLLTSGIKLDEPSGKGCLAPASAAVLVGSGLVWTGMELIHRLIS